MAGPATDVHHIGMGAFRVQRSPMARPHLHPEIELNLLVSGSAAYETPHATVELPRGRLVAFWGAVPHRLVGAPPIDLIAVTVPVSDLAGPPVLAGAARLLLGGEWLTGAEADGPGDAVLLRRWEHDLRTRPGSDAREVCLLEVRARLARLGADRGTAVTGGGGSTAAERLLTVVARHFTERLPVAGLAERAGLHPTYAAKVFTATFGVPVWKYVVGLRVAHARRLLETTDWPVDRVAHESGYLTRSAFNRAFTAAVGVPPARYRRGRPPGGGSGDRRR